jgi:hypothetical protein
MIHSNRLIIHTNDLDDSFILYFSIIDGLAIVRRHGCRHVERGYEGVPLAQRKIFVTFHL